MSGSDKPDLYASVAGTVMDEDLLAGYAEASLHSEFMGGEAPFAEEGQVGHDAFGLIDPASNKNIIQPVDDAERMLAMAEENVEPLSRQLEDLIVGLQGVEFGGARAKDPERMGQKLAGDRRADTMGDYLGGRIVVDDPAIINEIVRRLAHRYKNVEFDDSIAKPRESGYRAIHLQIVLDSGMTAEIQIMPSEILEVYESAHATYEAWRNKDTLSEEDMLEKEADEAKSKSAYEEAYQLWLQRADK